MNITDSNTNYVPAGFTPWLRPFYDENFTEYSRNLTGIPFLYDIFIGANYNDCSQLNFIELGKVKVSGSNSSLEAMLRKFDEAGVEYVIDKDRRDLIPQYVKNPIERFIRDSINTNIEMDLTENELVIEFNLEQYDWGWKPKNYAQLLEAKKK